jgi:hypothetical protein
MDCLLAGTNFAEFFSTWGGAQLIWGGSLGLASVPSDGHFGACDGDVGYVDNLLTRGELPTPSLGMLPLYVFMVPEGLIASNCYDAGTHGCNAWPDCGQLCENGVCGLNPGETNYDVSQPWLEAWATTYATCCWASGRTDLNLETSVIEHEVAESVANAMGGLGTCGDGCEGSTLYQFTGCPSQAGEPANWYELQNLSSQHMGQCNYQVVYTGLACDALDDGCASDADCCAPLVCGSGIPDVPDGGPFCCYPTGGRCALSTDCCAGLACSGGRCLAPADAGDGTGEDAGAAILGDAGIDGGAPLDAGRSPAVNADGGLATPERGGGGCSSGEGSRATCWLSAILALLLVRRRREGVGGAERSC